MLTLHHLNSSRSTRVLWLLEEIGMPYDLVRYQRTKQLGAPPELAEIHPLGKAPVIQDGDLVLAESAVILTYINTKYAGGRFAPATGTKAHAIHEEWLHYVESSAAFPVMLTLIGRMMGGLTPGLEQFSQYSLFKALQYISNGVGDGPYLSGVNFTIADIQMAYLLDMAASIGLLRDWEGLVAYLQRLKSRDGFVRAVEIGGEMTLPSES